jgi:hypothetical protein
MFRTEKQKFSSFFLIGLKNSYEKFVNCDESRRREKIKKVPSSSWLIKRSSGAREEKLLIVQR